MSFADLATVANANTSGLDAELAAMLAALWDALQTGRNTDRIRFAMAYQIRLTGFESFEAAVLAQGPLLSIRDVPDPVGDAGVARVAQVSDRVLTRVPTVLAQYDKRFTRAYARLLAHHVVMESIRWGIQTTATYGGATRKKFTRISGAREPREHSRLEGVVLRADGLWNIGGMLVDRPGDPRLPMSERAYCGHINVYLP